MIKPFHIIGIAILGIIWWIISKQEPPSPKKDSDMPREIPRWDIPINRDILEPEKPQPKNREV
jgi:hypothetical protein